MPPSSSPTEPTVPSSTDSTASFQHAEWSACERYCVSALSLLQGVLVAWAGWVLPWRSWTLFAVACYALATANGLTVVLALSQPLRALHAWRLSAWLSLLLLAIATSIVGQSSAYLVGVYGQLGAGLSAALIAVWGLVVLVTLPLGIWGLVRTRHVARWRWRWRPTGSMVALLVIASLLVAYRAQARARGVATPAMDETELLMAAQDALASLPRQRTRRLRSSPTARCEAAIDEQRLTLLVAYVAVKTQRPTVACLQANDSAELVRQFSRHLKGHAAGGYLKLDLVTHVTELEDVPRLISPLALRPGLDGLCWDRRCAAPWQLLSRGAFVSFRPLEFLRDLRLGVSFDELRAWLGADEATTPPPRRISTRSYSLDPDSNVSQLRRMRPPPGPLTRSELNDSLRRFEQHVVEAQANNGTFRYTLDPFTGKAERRHFNLARQAGTVLALCELGTDDKQLNHTIQQALSVFERHQRTIDDATAGLSLQASTPRLRLASTALPLAALLRCRPRVGTQFDDLISKLARFVLQLQRPNGDFFPEFDVRRGKPKEGAHPLFAPGQAILALILLDNQLDGLRKTFEVVHDSSETRREHSVNRERLRSAVKQAMDYIANQHWRTPVSSFFFIEENWHCLAAREALLNHRHASYERFCLDYMQFKRRHILEASSRVSEEFIGGFGFGNVVPPHNTGTAGFAEAMAAAIAVKHARNEDVASDVALLRQAVAFLVRQQWTPKNCFACVPEAMGSISEHTHSPTTRIDFVQHAWAGIGHSLPWIN